MDADLVTTFLQAGGLGIVFGAGLNIAVFMISLLLGSVKKVVQ